MGRKGPLLTLLGGAALASVLIALNVQASASQHKAGRQTTVATNASPAPSLSTVPLAPPLGAAQSTPPSAPPAEPPVSAPVVDYRATYAGSTGDGKSSIAIAVHDKTAIAYLCDGKKVEGWLRGTATGGKLNLTGSHQSSLTGTYAKGIATGKVTVGGKTWTFRARAVYPPSGLYKATATVRGAKIENGWIVLANGRQVGIMTVDGVPQEASTLNTDTRTADANGQTIAAVPVDGASGSGF